MEKIFETFSFAAILIILATALLGISWLITGKQKIKRGMCGKNPQEKKSEDCSTSSFCELCEKKPEETKHDEK